MLHRHAGPAVAGSYTGGAISGALVTGAALFVISGLLSPIPATYRGIVALSALLLLTLQHMGWVCLDLPQRAYQIRRETFTLPPRRAAFAFAFELGTGMRTYITATAPYALAVIMVLCLPSGLGPAGLASLAGAVGYGVGRSLIVGVQSIRRSIAVEHPTQWLRTADLISLATAIAVVIRFVANS